MASLEFPLVFLQRMNKIFSLSTYITKIVKFVTYFLWDPIKFTTHLYNNVKAAL